MRDIDLNDERVFHHRRIACETNIPELECVGLATLSETGSDYSP